MGLTNPFNRKSKRTRYYSI